MTTPATLADLRALWARRERIRAQYAAISDRPIGRGRPEFNPHQPRDPHGQWTDVGFGGVGGHYHAAGRTSAAHWTGADIAKVMEHPREENRSDPRLAEMWRQQGFDGKPTVVSAADFNALGDDHIRVYRGLHADAGTTGAEFAEGFRSGDEAFAGLGLFGNGIYTDVEKSNAIEYAHSDESGVLSMALKPDARIAEYADLRAATKELPDEVKAMVGDDPGKVATLLGYDALNLDKYYVVFNRTALVVQEAA